MCVENIFKTKKLQMKILLVQSQVALQKCQGIVAQLLLANLSNQEQY